MADSLHDDDGEVCARQAFVTGTDPLELGRQLSEALGPDPAVVFCFVAPSHDLEALGPALAAAFPNACVVGCTTSGQIGAAGFHPEGISATALSGRVHAEAFLIEPLDAMEESLTRATDGIATELATMPKDERAFGFLLVDGLSMREEELAAALYTRAARLPIIGGSAGDDLGFVQTHVLVDGAFHSNAAVLTMVRTAAPFTPVRVMHHVPSDKKMVVTEADPAQRVVFELDGRPAAETYAKLVGVSVGELGPAVFSKHPVMLQLGDDYYIRSIQRVEDGAIHFYCAIDRGLVLALAQPARVMESLSLAFEQVETRIGKPTVVLGCDCILRRLELEELGLAEDVGKFFADNHVVGFSTYGEQIDGLHMNQTFTGVALGRS